MIDSKPHILGVFGINPALMQTFYSLEVEPSHTLTSRQYSWRRRTTQLVKARSYPRKFSAAQETLKLASSARYTGPTHDSVLDFAKGIRALRSRPTQNRIALCCIAYSEFALEMATF